MENKITSIQLLEFGILDSAKSNFWHEADKSSRTGYFVRTENDEILFSKNTKIIKAEIDLAFGILYRINAINSHDIVTFYCEIFHPMLKNPKINEVYHSTNETKVCLPNEPNFDFYQFENDWEMQEGLWRFVLKQNQKVLLDFDFTISLSDED